MNETITIDGKDYEVLTLDNSEEWTHLKTGEGKVVRIVNSIDDSFEVLLSDGSPFFFRSAAITDLGIQPLKLIERNPVEFVADFALIGSHWYPLHTLDDAQGSDNNKKMKFRCVQITEEA